MAYSAAVSSVQFTLYHIAQSHDEHTDVNEITISWSLVAVYVVSSLRWVEHYSDPFIYLVINF